MLVAAIAVVVALGAIAIFVWPRRGQRGPEPFPDRSKVYAAEAYALETADVGADVNAALSAGDQRLVGIMGYREIVPGIPENDRALVERLGARFIPNTSDAMEDAEHARLQHAAYEYARRYNGLLLASTRPTTRPT